jgi:uncharacterized protein YndB with AHSA1/START domain
MLLVQPLQITTPSDREIEIRRQFAAPRRLVFDAHTRPELVRKWLFGPEGWSFLTCEIDLRVGGRYRFVWRKDTGQEMAMGGVYREIAAPDRLVTTELFDQDWTGGETISTLELSEAGGVTTLVNNILYASREARDGALKSGMDYGMEAGYQRLDALFAAPVG